MRPLARKENLIVQNSDDELLVYDVRANRAVSLNITSKLVWNLCDGKRSPWEIGKQIEKEQGVSVSEDLIWFALNQLNDRGLLTNREDFTYKYQSAPRLKMIERLRLRTV